MRSRGYTKHSEYDTANHIVMKTGAIKIRIKKDTPLHQKGYVLDLETFLKSYGSILSSYNNGSDIYQLPVNQISVFPEWFEVIEEPKFEIGDWVWHNNLGRACLITTFKEYRVKEFWPNYVSEGAVNENPKVYTRKATTKEINDAVLTSFAEGRVLVGKKDAYFWTNVWKPIGMVDAVVNDILYYRKKMANSFVEVENEIMNTEYHISLETVKFGCVTVDIDEIKAIAQIRGILP